ncbi:hypothetical protein [Actinoplanes sp. L3-i22]|uniref:hypothetical protein n=1 Tax=Actinoplanes sp. L3-i22 TaxID=2836373 RepID=UPI001C756F0F|nr:hypothetical protein [Actinoplanes sp. L3-i22]BCY08346.1 hypothetical protein L3i22_034340 [Actinoplanes sp. L3-i22]
MTTTVDEDRYQLLDGLLADTRLDAAAARRPLRPAPAHLLTVSDQGPVIALPDPAPPRAELDDVLADRVAVRDYAPTPLTTAEVSAICAAADLMDVEAWPREQQAGLGLELYLAAWRVDGVDTGLYRYLPEQRALRRVADLPSGAEAAELVMQEEFAEAAALLLITGNLAGAIDRHGSHGHRLLLTRGGAAGHAAWLAALRLRLVGTVFAGLLPHVLRERAGADGYHRAPLLAFAAGRAAADATA